MHEVHAILITGRAESGLLGVVQGCRFVRHSWAGLHELGDTFLIQLGREQDRYLLNVDAIGVYGLVASGHIFIFRAFVL